MRANSRVYWPRSINMAPGETIDEIPSPTDERLRVVHKRQDGSVVFDEIWVGDWIVADDGWYEIRYKVDINQSSSTTRQD